MRQARPPPAACVAPPTATSWCRQAPPGGRPQSRWHCVCALSRWPHARARPRHNLSLSRRNQIIFRPLQLHAQLSYCDLVRSPGAHPIRRHPLARYALCQWVRAHVTVCQTPTASLYCRPPDASHAPPHPTPPNHSVGPGAQPPIRQRILLVPLERTVTVHHRVGRNAALEHLAPVLVQPESGVVHVSRLARRTP